MRPRHRPSPGEPQPCSVGELDPGQVRRPPVDTGNGERCFEEPVGLPVGLLEITSAERGQRLGVTGIPLHYPDAAAWELIASPNRRTARNTTPRLPAAGLDLSFSDFRESLLDKLGRPGHGIGVDPNSGEEIFISIVVGFRGRAAQLDVDAAVLKTLD